MTNPEHQVNAALDAIKAVENPVERAKAAAEFIETLRTKAMPAARQIRQAAVLELRAGGMSHADVGAALGVSRNQAQLIAEGRTSGTKKKTAPSQAQEGEN